jgi:hypothetical protein
MSLRFYLFPKEGRPQTMSRRLIEGLVRGTQFLPQYANTRQRAPDAFVEHVDGKPDASRTPRGTTSISMTKGASGRVSTRASSLSCRYLLIVRPRMPRLSR